MKPHLPLAVIAVAAIAGMATAAPNSAPVSALTAAASSTVATPAPPVTPPPPATQSRDNAFAYTDWDDDDDDRRRYGPMPRPDIRALNRAGIVHVSDVERDDGHLEIEGYDAQGRKMEARMDIRGQRVLGAWRDRDDDRWDDRDDDRWDD